MNQVTTSLNQHYNNFKKKYKTIAGVDEAGRGPLVGNVVAAAVVLPDDIINNQDQNSVINIITDSKKLTEKKRELAYDYIIQNALSYGIAHATPKEIDSINILQASLLAMSRAVAKLTFFPECVLVDGKFVPKDLINNNSKKIFAYPVIKGDLLEVCISAASILAKVTRDRQMQELDQIYPQYGFKKHKGYPTKDHIAKLKEHGPCPLHRFSFGPLKQFSLVS